MNKFNFLIVGVCASSTLFGMESKVSSPVVASKIAVVNKDKSNDFLARRKSSGSSKNSPSASPRYSSRSRLSSGPEVPQNSPQLERVRRQSYSAQCNTGALFIALSTIKENSNQQDI